MRVIFFDLDTLRPDHLGCYGYHRNTSPNIDKIANKGVSFEEYHCSDAPCLPSRAALMSGKFGIHNGAVGHGGTTGDMDKQGSERGFKSTIGTDALPYIFRDAGYKTASISPFGERHSSFWFYSGFNEIFNTGKGGTESAEDITPTVLNWLDNNNEKEDWFLHINYWDAHTCYRAPKEFGNPFEKEPIPSWITKEHIKEGEKAVGGHSPWEISMYDDKVYTERQPGTVLTMDDAKKMIDGYDCGIAYMDSHIGMILDYLEEKNMLEDTAIIVSADHGENMGELQIWGEHATADYVTTRIPFIIKWPNSKKGILKKGKHYNLDLAPTLAELMNINAKPSWDGKSYAKELFSEDLIDDREELIVSQCAHVCQRSVLFNDYIYIRTYHDGFRLYPQEMLFNIKIDPHEQNDIAKQNPILCREGAWRLLTWHDEMMSTKGNAIDPLWTTIREGGPFHANGQLKEYTKRLKETGRGDSIKELIKRHPGEFN